MTHTKPPSDAHATRSRPAASGLIATQSNGSVEYLAGFGIYAAIEGRTNTALNPAATQAVAQAFRTRQNLRTDDSLACYCRSSETMEHVLFLHDVTQLRGEQFSLFPLYTTFLSEAFKATTNNAPLHTTQRDCLFTLCEVAEDYSAQFTQHVQRVAAYASIMGTQYGFNAREIEALSFAAGVHDLGKIGIADTILRKPQRLTPEEYAQVKQHTIIGSNILSTSQHPDLQLAATIAMEHHERWDGTGYPRELKGEEISLPSRITMLADVFDALGSHSVYRNAWLISDVLNFIEEKKGTMFDPTLVSLFMENLDKFLEIRDRYAND